tara:strand:- start:25039 stop:26058 length:1020 start_codon:yes stop_codon:yes gene_type:complete
VSLCEPNLRPYESLTCFYTSQPVEQLLSSTNVLAVISSGEPNSQVQDPRHFHCGLGALDRAQEQLQEVFYSDVPVATGIEHGVRWSRNKDMLIAALWMDACDSRDLRQAGRDAYQRLLRFVIAEGYPQIIRMWNYLPDINRGEGDDEGYRQFCQGRQEAFYETRYPREAFPAACALGHHGDGSVIYLLAGKSAPLHIENPRQESAYNYPRQYGPASPSFARAGLVHWPVGSQLYLSGTASIVGHQSRHINNLAGQLQTTFDNIDSLLAQAKQQASLAASPVPDLLKVYVRHAADYQQVADSVNSRFPGVSTLYLQADICRRELLVEIDGMCNQLPRTRA